MRQPHARKASSVWNAASQRQYAVGDQLTGGSAGLRPGRPEATPCGVTVLGDDQYGATPLATECEALDERSTVSRIGASAPTCA